MTPSIEIIAHVFVDRIAWVIVVEQTVHGRGVARDIAELRGVQIRAGIATVALIAAKEFKPTVRAACEQYFPEWAPATAEETARFNQLALTP